MQKFFPSRQLWVVPTRTILAMILFFAFVTRIVRLEVPPRYIFDEVYHAVTAKLIAHNDPRAFEWWNQPPEPNTAVDWLHPPLAKYTQALAMLIVGETSFGWRLSSALFGVGVIWLTYVLTKTVLEDEVTALLAAFVASLDGLLLTQSRVAMNDIHVTFFILLSLAWYWRYYSSRSVGERGTTRGQIMIESRWLWLTGIGIGLATSSKWSGFFLWPILGCWEGWWWLQTIKKWWFSLPLAQVATHWRVIGQTLAAVVAIPIVIYVASYSLMFIQGKSLFCFRSEYIQGQCYFERWQILDRAGQPTATLWEGYTSHFGELHRQIWWYQTSLTATHDYQSRPWQWFLNLRPVWFHVDYVSDTHIANIYAQSNPILSWVGALVVLITAVLIVQDILAGVVAKLVAVGVAGVEKTSPRQSELVVSLLPLIAGTRSQGLVFLTTAYFLVWLPWVLSPRIMFFYHYTPSVPLLATIVAFWVRLLLKSRSLVLQRAAGLILALMAAGFVIWYPNWTAIPVSKAWADVFYFGVKGWK